MAGVTEMHKRRRSKPKINRRWGSALVKLAVEISGRSESMVYAVLAGRAISKPVSRALQEARERLAAKGNRVA